MRGFGDSLVPPAIVSLSPVEANRIDGGLPGRNQLLTLLSVCNRILTGFDQGRILSHPETKRMVSVVQQQERFQGILFSDGQNLRTDLRSVCGAAWRHSGIRQSHTLWARQPVKQSDMQTACLRIEEKVRGGGIGTAGCLG